MLITENQLRRIIRQTILEEQNRIDKAGDTSHAIKSAAIALAMVGGSHLLTNAGKQLTNQNDRPSISRTAPRKVATYNNMRGKELSQWVLKNIDSIPKKDLNKVAAAINHEAEAPKGSAAQASSRRIASRNSVLAMAQMFATPEGEEEYNRSYMREY